MWFARRTPVPTANAATPVPVCGRTNPTPLSLAALDRTRVYFQVLQHATTTKMQDTRSELQRLASQARRLRDANEAAHDLRATPKWLPCNTLRPSTHHKHT